MKNSNFSHFANGENNNKSNQAMLNGYSFGDRMLDGIMFIITITNGKLSAKVCDEDSEKFSYYVNSEKKWLKKAVKCAKWYDMFISLNSTENLFLFMDDGRFNCEWYDEYNNNPINKIKIK